MLNLKDLKLQNGYWYLATPYSKYPAGLEFAFTHACHAAGALLGAGVHIYSPIAHTQPIALHGGLDPYSHEMFMPLDEQIMRGAHGIIVVKMPGWRASKGVDIELQNFRDAGKPLVFLQWPGLAIEKGSIENFTVMAEGHETLEDAGALERFRNRLVDDGAVDFSKEKWDEWVDALPRDEFLAMLSIGMEEKKP